jgi:uncharacterized glyoxalase superfamily protein PhnB
MEMKQLVPDLMVDDVAKTITFYQDVLGFKTVATAPENAPVLCWALIKNGGVHFMLQSRSSFVQELPSLNAPKAGGTLIFYITVPDVQGWYASIKGKAKIVTDLRETTYGTKEFALEDCNGYVLVIADDPHCA